jgi:hypothetical protein
MYTVVIDLQLLLEVSSLGAHRPKELTSGSLSSSWQDSPGRGAAYIESQKCFSKNGIPL